MINVLTLCFSQYLKTPFEDFTSKYITAIGLFKLLDNYDPKDIEELKLIEKWTDPKIKVSIYKLDRVVNPTKGEFTTIEKKFTFSRDIKESDKKLITLTENQIQEHLCVAIRRVHQIVIKNLKDYKIEQSMNQDDDIDEEFDGMIKDV